MRLIVNTNRIIAALIKDSYSRKIINSRRFELVTPEFANVEIRKYKAEILKKAHISETDFEGLMSKIFTKIYVIEDSLIKKKEKQARTIMDAIDPKDSPFIAAALSIQNDGIWSDDPHFLEQKSILVWKTKDLTQYI